jgi:urea carboxylase-associated protein 1
MSATSVRDEVVPARGYTAFEMERGQELRLEDLEGEQAIDVVFYNRDDLGERFWAAHSAKLNGTIYLTTGHTLYSNLAKPMATFIDDSVGKNDVICGSCSYELDHLRYGAEKAHPGCMENFEAAIKPWGLARADIPLCLNIFLDYPVAADGGVSMDRTAPSRAGDYVLLHAAMDLLVAISNCPQDNNPCTGWNPSPIRVTVADPVADHAVAAREETTRS